MADSAAARKPEPLRLTIARGFTRVEDVVYIGLGVLLGLSAAALLVNVAIGFGRSVLSGASSQSIVDLLDRMLLILMIVELLYTVQVPSASTRSCPSRS
jgi:hypothetical protein